MIRSLSLGLFVFAVLPFGVSFADDSSGHIVTPASEITWSAAPSFLPAGAQVAVLSGDPNKEGPFVMRLKMPAQYRIPAHSHGSIERVTVIHGTFYLGFGDEMNLSKATRLPEDSYFEMTPNVNHYAFSRSSETIIELHGDGPFTMTYVNANDNPENKD